MDYSSIPPFPAVVEEGWALDIPDSEALAFALLDVMRYGLGALAHLAVGLLVADAHLPLRVTRAGRDRWWPRT